MREKNDIDILKYQGTLLRKFLRKYRKEYSNMTMEQAATALGRSKTWLSDIENGTNNIYAQDMIMLLKLYHADINDFSKEMSEYMNNPINK